MNILFITKEIMNLNEAPPSRILNFKKILEKYHEVYIIASGSQLKDRKIKSIPIKLNNFFISQIYKIIMLFYSLNFILKYKIDYVITREYYYVVMLYVFSRILGFEIIYDMHCFRYKELKVENKKVKAGIMKHFEILSHKLADHIIAVSKGIYEDLSVQLKKKSLIIYNGVNLKEFSNKNSSAKILEKYGISKNKKIVGFIGNWMEWVDVSSLLKSSEKFKKNIKLVVVGECYKKISIDELEKKYPDVVFTGRIPHKDVVLLLNHFDVCVLPYKKADVLKHLSIRKTFEYLAAGKPIIMSDSNISEKDFLREGKNYILYEAENASDLAKKVNNLLGNKKMMNKISKNNLMISKKFSWEKQIMNSDLLNTVSTYEISKKKIKGKVSIIIKALNEEDHIAECIESALAALKGLDGEVILVDSKSTDRTVEIAKKYPIKIIQLAHNKDRCCGVGPQLGYLHSNGDFVYILDGDMTLDKDFIRKALPYFGNNNVSGVGGNIFERSKENLAFQVRTKNHVVDKITEVEQLGMGGLYRKDAVEKVGYFSNPYFYAYEEFDIGAKLRKKGYVLLRIPEKMIEHFGDESTSFETLVSRWKSSYLLGSGQYLRKSISGGHFLKTLIELKIYVFTLFWLLFGFVSLMSLAHTSIVFLFYLFLTVFFLIGLLLIKRNITKTVFSLVSWNFQAIGMLVGIFAGSGSPDDFKAEVKVVKNG
ncbi:glycosyltransferase [Candidatus Woesearchaeota archaeon]|nr:glycosyltransferase [Candidatus Woesearchaeota archaeon]